MEISLHINDSTCIKCGKCVRVCPSKIFVQKKVSDTITLQNINTCIVCGHCADVCPTASVIHSEFPSEKVHKIDYSQMPSPEQVLLLCKARRSNRAFLKQPVPHQLIETILEAAHRAPTASNMQQVAFTVVTDPDKLKQVTSITLDMFASLKRKLENPILKPIIKKVAPQVARYVPVFQRLISENRKGRDLILRGATALIFIHTPENNRFGSADANLAYQNGSLMAESLGVSQFYTGFVCKAIHLDNKKRIAELFGIKGKIHAGMALGMPAFKYDNYSDRKDIEVNWF